MGRQRNRQEDIEEERQARLERIIAEHQSKPGSPATGSGRLAGNPPVKTGPKLARPAMRHRQRKTKISR